VLYAKSRARHFHPPEDEDYASGENHGGGAAPRMRLSFTVDESFFNSKYRLSTSMKDSSNPSVVPSVAAIWTLMLLKERAIAKRELMRELGSIGGLVAVSRCARDERGRFVRRLDIAALVHPGMEPPASFCEGVCESISDYPLDILV